MLARLRENWQFRFIAVAGAILLHFYVTSQQNPIQTRTLTIPIVARNLPDALMVPGKAPVTTVSLTGTTDDINRVTLENVTATVDMKHASAGPNLGLVIDVELSPPAIKSNITVSEPHPRTATIQVVERRRRRLPVTAVVEGSFEAGYSAKKPVVTPSIATVSGPADAVNSVVRLVVKPDVTGATGAVDDDFPIIAVDSQGSDVPSVKVKPDSAHVQVEIVEAERTADVFVTPAITGVPAPGFVIGEVSTVPRSVTLTGEAHQLATITRLATERVDISGASKDVTAHVRCVPPAGGTMPADTTVTVTIKIVPAVAAPPVAQISPPAVH